MSPNLKCQRNVLLFGEIFCLFFLVLVVLNISCFKNAFASLGLNRYKLFLSLTEQICTLFFKMNASFKEEEKNNRVHLFSK